MMLTDGVHPSLGDPTTRRFLWAYVDEMCRSHYEPKYGQHWRAGMECESAWRMWHETNFRVVVTACMDEEIRQRLVRRSEWTDSGSLFEAARINAPAGRKETE